MDSFDDDAQTKRKEEEWNALQNARNDGECPGQNGKTGDIETKGVEDVLGSPSSEDEPDSLEPKDVDEAIQYEKEVLDDIIDAITIYDKKGNRVELFNDLMEEVSFEEPTETGEIENILEGEYSETEIENNLEVMEEYDLIENDLISERALGVAEIGKELSLYLEEIESELLDVEAEGEENDMIDTVTATPSQRYAGKATEGFTDKSREQQLGNFLDIFNRNNVPSDSDTNRLMAFLTAVQQENVRGLADASGYGTDASARETMRDTANEGYLDITDGEVELTPAGEAVKSVVDCVYEIFEDLHYDRTEERTEKMRELVNKRKDSNDKAIAYDNTVETIIRTGIMDPKEAEAQFKQNSDSVARQLSEKYETDFNPEDVDFSEYQEI